MLIDVAKNIKQESKTGILSRCKVCGRYYSWECPTDKVYFDFKKGKKRPMIEPKHCGSSVCTDFWKYYEEIKAREYVDFDFARHLYLKRKGIM